MNTGNLLPSARRWVAALSIASACAALTAASAGALPPGGAKPSHNGANVKLSPTRVKPGGRIHVTGTRFPAGKTVSVKLDDEKVGVVAVLKASGDGRVNGVVTIPVAVKKVLAPGRHWLRFLASASAKNHQSMTSVKKTFTLTR